MFRWSRRPPFSQPNGITSAMGHTSRYIARGTCVRIPPDPCASKTLDRVRRRPAHPHRLSAAGFGVDEVEAFRSEVAGVRACRRPTVILCEQGSEPLFDVRGHRHLTYQSIRELREKLAKEVAALPFGR